MRQPENLESSPLPETLTVAEAFHLLAERFRQKGFATPELDARLLVCHAAGLSHEAFFLASQERLSSLAREELHQAFARRLAHEPVSRILGRRSFWKHDFCVTPATLDPRPETETLVETALKIVKTEGWKDQPVRILDLGVGSGAILLSLLAELPKAWGVGVDKSFSALTVTRHNARALGVADRLALIQGDWLTALAGNFHLILTNPPYIPSQKLATLPPEVARYDPPLALYGGDDGLTAYRSIIPCLPSCLNAGGYALLEVGDAAQAAAVLDILRGTCLTDPVTLASLHTDLSGSPRCVVAWKG